MRFKLETDSDGEFTCSVRFYQRPHTRRLTNGAPAETCVSPITTVFCGNTFECLYSVDVLIFFACVLEELPMGPVSALILTYFICILLDNLLIEI